MVPLTRIAGQPSVRIGSGRVEAFVTERGGHLGPVTFHLPDGDVQPFAVAPWAEDPPEGLPPILQVLRGDFFCLPFGSNTSAYGDERHPLHGETANGRWDIEEAGPDFVRMSMSLQARPGRVIKEIVLRPEETAVYSRHRVEGMRGPMSVGHHAMLRFPADEGEGLISLSPFEFGQVFPGQFEDPDAGGRSSLAPGARFSDLGSVPLASGGTTDLSRYPARKGFEDLAMVYSQRDQDLAWSAVAFPSRGYLWISLKDPRVLTGTILWHSNGGRDYSPWNGRHRGVLGVEEVTAYFHMGLAESVGPNAAALAGFRTSVSLSPERPLAVNTVMAVAPIGADFDHVASVTPIPGGIRVASRSGRKVEIALDLGFLYDRQAATAAIPAAAKPRSGPAEELRHDAPVVALPTLDDIVQAIGETGRRMSEIGASEGAAGNISVFLGWEFARHREFVDRQSGPTPVSVPELGGAHILVTGSGRRLREVHADPFANLAYVEILPGGDEMVVWTARRRLFEAPTSEFNTHLAIHACFAPAVRPLLHTVVHAQPMHLTYLSHVPRYQDERFLNRHILRWQPELIVQMPEGIGVAPFMLPGSEALMQTTIAQMANHQLVVWAKHGAIARSVHSVKKAGDLVEYAETGARYEYLNLVNHGLADGLTPAEVRLVSEAFGKPQKYF